MYGAKSIQSSRAVRLHLKILFEFYESEFVASSERGQLRAFARRTAKCKIALGILASQVKQTQRVVAEINDLLECRTHHHVQGNTLR
eukprot:scaffold562301_cov34-Prasinocladus_malaysianus.AAC.1